MPTRTFTKRFSYQPKGGSILSFRAEIEYEVEPEVADFADQHGFTKAIGAAPENKNLGDAPSNKRARGRPRTRALADS